MKKPPTSEMVEMDLHADPRGRVLLTIQEITNDVTDGFATTDPEYVPLYEGFTAFETEYSSTRVYLVMTKGNRVLIYGVEVPSVPSALMYSRAEADQQAFKKCVFMCIKLEVDNPDDISYLLAAEDDIPLVSMPTCSPVAGQTNEGFIESNALWLSNPVVN